MRSFTSGVFVTGTTGILGSHFLKTLLEETEGPIHCLVRAPSVDAGFERLFSALSSYGTTEPFLTQLRERVHIELGDVASEKLGLTSERYETLTRSVEAVIHIAAITDLFLPYPRIAPVNVGGTKNVIEFTLQTRNKYLCHVSTHTIVGSRVFEPTTVFKETDYDIGQQFDYLSYQRTKFESEGIVRAAKADGLVWNIMRPGQIFGDSKTGAYPFGHSAVTGLFYDIWRTVIESGLAFQSDTHFDVVPVDYVSRGILELGLNRDSKYETYHLINPDITRYTQVVERIASLGYAIQQLPQPEYEQRLRSRTARWDGGEFKSPTTSAFRWWFKRGINFRVGGYTSCAYTAKLLKEMGVECPPIDKKLLGVYVDACVRSGYFPTAPRTAQAMDRRVTDEPLELRENA